MDSFTQRMANREDNNGLLQIIKTARTKGKSYLEIERLYGIAAPRAEAILKAHYKDRAASFDANEERMLMLERLESLIEPLMDMAELGNIKSAEVLIKNLEAINTLLGLNLEQTKVEITVINQRQTTVIVDVMGVITRSLLKHVQDNVSDEKALALIEDTWDEVVSKTYDTEATKMIEAEMIVDN